MGASATYYGVGGRAFVRVINHDEQYKPVCVEITENPLIKLNTVIKQALFSSIEFKEYTVRDGAAVEGIDDGLRANGDIDVDDAIVVERTPTTKHILGTHRGERVIVKCAIVPERVHDIEHEIRIHAQIPSRFVPRLVGKYSALPGIVYVYIDRPNLRHELSLLSDDEKVHVMYEMRRLVMELHANGVFLGDIKCENFVRSGDVDGLNKLKSKSNMELKLVDLDSCDTLPPLGRLRVGSKEWDHPERRRRGGGEEENDDDNSDVLSEKHDLFSLTSTFIEIITNKDPDPYQYS
ncbi:hypothetical protein IWW48_006308 [Coemansia sp. RSA 1200]|nr:hypothetical protein IWW48_006308 [Coemansia sp. RSA 1200]